MVLCRYFAQGRCIKGAQCEFEHPGQVTLATAGAGSHARGGFGGSAGRGGYAQRGRGSHVPSHTQRAPPEVKFEDVIKHDLTEVNINWPLSCYGINTDWEAGDNILHGDFSPEELRMEAYAQMRTAGNIDSYRAMLSTALLSKQQATAQILEDLSRAVAQARIPRAQRLSVYSLGAQNVGSTAPSISGSTIAHQTQPNVAGQLPGPFVTSSGIQPHPHFANGASINALHAASQHLPNAEYLQPPNHMAPSHPSTARNASGQSNETFAFGSIPEMPLK